MKIGVLLLLCSCLMGCSTFGTVKKTTDLQPGMTMDEVRNTLGRPSQTQFISGKIVWKYNLHQYWKGWVPYYLAFDQNNKTLEYWSADEEEYYRQQKLWLEAMPKTINVNENITGTVNHNVSGHVTHEIRK